MFLSVILSLKMVALCPDASLETFWPLCYPGTHRLQGDLCRCFHKGSLQAVQVGVMLSASHVLQFIVQGVETWTPWGPILVANKIRNIPQQPLLSHLGLVGRSWVLLEVPFLTIEDSCVKLFHNSLQHVLLIHLGTSFHTFLIKMKRCHPMMGHSPPNHDLGRVMASCTLRMHLKGLLNVNRVVLVVILLVNGENFLVHEEDVFVSVLSMPLEEKFSSCPSDFLRSKIKEVSLWVEVRSHV